MPQHFTNSLFTLVTGTHLSTGTCEWTTATVPPGYTFPPLDMSFPITQRLNGEWLANTYWR